MIDTAVRSGISASHVLFDYWFYSPQKFGYSDCSIHARLVYVHNRSKHKDYLVLISTDMPLLEEETIRIDGKCWDIEVFFNVSKT
ncbi:MAG: hypothetical protein VB076_06070 [Synergistaceae bacterium]|nr:hypothetical protein [Synergistaceae bacterium]